MPRRRRFGPGPPRLAAPARGHRDADCRADDDFGSSGDRQLRPRRLWLLQNRPTGNSRACLTPLPSDATLLPPPATPAIAPAPRLNIRRPTTEMEIVDPELVELAVAAATAFFCVAFARAVRFTMDATENFPSSSATV